jgi:predicted CXXCH cytochrome family protein
MNTTPHPISGRENCLTCHPAEKLPADHANRGEPSCVFCHPEDPAAAKAPETPHAIAGREACLTCHPASKLPADHASRPEANCLVCHPEVEGMAGTPGEAPKTPHAIAGREACLTCHPVSKLPADHASRPEASCTACHPEAPAAPAGEAPKTPHAIAGREACLICHPASKLPADHASRTEASCAACHPEAPAAPTPGPSTPMDDQGCLACHSNPGLTLTFPGCGTTLSLTVDSGVLGQSVHGKAGLTCTSCHQDITGYPHPPFAAEDCRAFIIARAESCIVCHSEISEAQHDSIHARFLAVGNRDVPTCVECHGGHDVAPPDEPRHKLSQTCGQEGCHTSILTAYERSIHGSVIVREEDNPYVPVCEDCHGAHQMPDPRTGQFQAASPELCAFCHTDPNVVARYGLSTDVYQDYRDGIHGQLREKDPNIQTPLCTDCHGVHDVQGLRDNALAASETCAHCHTAIYGEFKQGVHGEALITGNKDVPGCTYCHGAHKIPDPNTPQFRIGEPDLCASCHSDPVLMAKYGLSPDVYITYTEEFHGRAVELYRTRWPEASIFCYEAVCTDCHGIHEIRATHDPKSSVHPDNLIHACRDCHPSAPPNFAGAWTGHYKVTRERAPLTYYVNLFYAILIPTVIGGMVLFVFSDIGRRVVTHFKRGKSA